MTKRTLLLALTPAILLATQCFGADISIAPKDSRGNILRGSIGISGPITEGDYDRFRAVLKDADGRYDAIVIDSPGGNVREALSIGRLVRRLRMSTGVPFRIGDQYYLALAGERDLHPMCASACFLIWAAGIERGDGVVGLHGLQQSLSRMQEVDSSTAMREYQSIMAELRDYLSEMDLPDSIFYRIQSLRKGDVDWLDLETDGKDRALVGIVPSIAAWIDARCRKVTAQDLRDWEAVRRDGIPFDQLPADRQAHLTDIFDRYDEELDCKSNLKNSLHTDAWFEWRVAK